MHGLLADVNIEGHLPYLMRLMEREGILEILTEFGISLVNFPELRLDRETNDKALWHFCQENGWVLLTDNRNNEDEHSLDATIQDSWREGRLPVLTLGQQEKVREK